MQVYELGYLLLPSISEEDLPEVVGKIKSLISNEIGSEDPIKIDLAYTMTKTVGAARYVVDDGYIGWGKFDSEPEAVALFRNKVAEMDEVLRFIIIKAPRETVFTFAKVQEALSQEPVEEVVVQ